MKLKDKLKQEVVLALKKGDKPRVAALRYIVSLLDKKEMSLPPDQMTEADERSVLRKELKNKEESKKMFSEAGRDDLVAETDFEIKVLKSYLPAEMTKKDVEKIVVEVMAGQGTNFGAVMGAVMKKVAGRADGNLVASVVKEKLSEEK